MTSRLLPPSSIKVSFPLKGVSPPPSTGSLSPRKISFSPAPFGFTAVVGAAFVAGALCPGTACGTNAGAGTACGAGAAAGWVVGGIPPPTGAACGGSSLAITTVVKAAAIAACRMGFIVINIVVGARIANFSQKNIGDSVVTQLRNCKYPGFSVVFWPRERFCPNSIF